MGQGTHGTELSSETVRAALCRATRAIVEEGGLAAVTTRSVVARAFGHDRQSMIYAYFRGMSEVLESLSDHAAALVLGHATAWAECGASAADIGARLLRLRGK